MFLCFFLLYFVYDFIINNKIIGEGKIVWSGTETVVMIEVHDVGEQ